MSTSTKEKEKTKFSTQPKTFQLKEGTKKYKKLNKDNVSKQLELPMVEADHLHLPHSQDKVRRSNHIGTIMTTTMAAPSSTGSPHHLEPILRTHHRRTCSSTITMTNWKTLTSSTNGKDGSRVQSTPFPVTETN
jgi:hypothetical protein